MFYSIHSDFNDGTQSDFFRDRNISSKVERAPAARALGAGGIAKRPLRNDRRDVQPSALEAYLEQSYLPGSLQESKSHFIVSCDARLIDYHYLRLLLCCSQSSPVHCAGTGTASRNERSLVPLLGF